MADFTQAIKDAIKATVDAGKKASENTRTSAGNPIVNAVNNAINEVADISTGQSSPRESYDGYQVQQSEPYYYQPTSDNAVSFPESADVASDIKGSDDDIAEQKSDEDLAEESVSDAESAVVVDQGDKWLGDFNSFLKSYDIDGNNELNPSATTKTSNELNPSVTTKTSTSMEEKEKDLRNAVAEENADRVERERQLMYSQLMASAANSGGSVAAPYMNPYFEETVDEIDSLDSYPFYIGELARRIPGLDPSEWNLVGFSSQNKSSDAVKDLYEHNFAKEGNNYSEPYIAGHGAEDTDLTNEGRNDLYRQLLSMSVNSGGAVASPYSSPLFEDTVDSVASIDKDPILTGELIDRTMIDDGSETGSHEGILMTGDQYIKYREWGIPGRDVSDIKPDKLYSKQREMTDYGFTPYLVSDEGFNKFHDIASTQTVNDAFNWLSNLRRSNTDFDVFVDGHPHSGNDFVKQMSMYGNDIGRQLSDAVSNSDNYSYTTDPSQTNQYSRAFDGLENRKTGEVARYTPDEVRIIAYDGDGTYRVELPNGEYWDFDNAEDIRDNYGMHEAAFFGDPLYWYTPDLSGVSGITLEDGTQVDGLTAMNLQQKVYDGVEDQDVDYGPMNMGKPAPSLPEADIGSIGNWLQNGEWLPWLADIALGSAPYFHPVTGAVDGTGRAFSYLYGINPDVNIYDGTYNLISENPTKEQGYSQALGAAITPWTEQLWGPLGYSAMKSLPGLSKLASKEKSWNPGLRWATGGLGEALEEIPGNLTEELERSGFKEFYQDYDPWGMVDTQGRPLRVPTSFLGGVENFGEDIPEAMIGGAALGGVLGSPRIPEYISDYRKWKADMAETGNIAEDIDRSLGRRLTQDEIDKYNR